MLTGKSLINLPIYATTDGVKLGDIQEIYLNSAASIITAIAVGKEGLFNKKIYVVPRDAITVFGVDTWLVLNSEAVMNLEDVPQSATFIALSKLKGRQINTDGGTAIAAFDDAIFDSDGDVLGFTLSKIAVKGPIADRKTISRHALLDLGNDKTPAIASLSKAESLPIE